HSMLFACVKFPSIAYYLGFHTLVEFVPVLVVSSVLLVVAAVTVSHEYSLVGFVPAELAVVLDGAAVLLVSSVVGYSLLAPVAQLLELVAQSEWHDVIVFLP